MSNEEAAQRGPTNDNLEEAIQYAKKYFEDLLSFFGLNTDVHATTEDDVVIELDVPSTHLNGFLIGVAGDTLRSLQQVIGSALKNQGFAHSRVNIDVAGYKKQRAERIAKQAEVWFKEVKDSGQSKALEPMNAADRRIVHKVAGEWGIATESVGFGRERHVVLKPSSELSRPSAEADDGEAAQKSTAGKPEGAEDAPAEKVEEPADQSPAEE